MSKAATAGRRDADTWMNETPEDEWADAIKPGVLGADEALINALGSTEAAKYLGISAPYRNGKLTRAASAAFGEYSRAWANRVSAALRPIHAEKAPTRQHATRKPVARATITQAVESLSPHYAKPSMLKEMGWSQREIEAAVRRGDLAWLRDGSLKAVR